MKVDQCNKKLLFCCFSSFFRRSFSLLLILALLPMCLAVPVFADEVEDAFSFNYYDFTDESNLRLYVPGSPIGFQLPSSIRIQYLDTVVTFGSSVIPSDVTAIIGSINRELQFVQISGNTYRIFGSIARSTSSFFLDFGLDSEQYITFHYLDLYQTDFLSESLDAHGFGYAYKYPNNELLSWSSTNTQVIWGYSSYEEFELYNGSFTAWFDVDDWQAYDYIDIEVSLFVRSVTSVSASLGTLALPVQLNYIDLPGGGSSSQGFVLIQARIDLSGLDRTYSDHVSLIVQGQGNYGNSSGRNIITLRSAYGLINGAKKDPLSFWLGKIQSSVSSGFNSVVSSISGLGGSISAFSTNVGTWIANQTDSLTDSISSVFDQLITVRKSVVNTIETWSQSVIDSIGSGVDAIVDAITGGDNADDLQHGANQIGEAGSNLGSNIGSIHDFEDQYFGQLDSNMGTIISGGNISGIVAPLAFVQRYTNMIVSGIPSNFLVIFTLPILLGIFMYIVGHPIKAPRPDTSGDIVTRETFIETTILSGPGAGRTRTTRTVTTSSEIGRVHNE